MMELKTINNALTRFAVGRVYRPLYAFEVDLAAKAPSKNIAAAEPNS
jgi:hypothetical protein